MENCYFSYASYISVLNVSNLLRFYVLSHHECKRWGPYQQVFLWGFNMGKLKCFQIAWPVVCYKYRSLHTGVYISTVQGLHSIPCGQRLDRTLGRFPPIYGPHLILLCMLGNSCGQLKQAYLPRSLHMALGELLKIVGKIL